MIVTRNVTPIKSVTRAVTVPVTRNKSVTNAVTRNVAPEVKLFEAAKAALPWPSGPTITERVDVLEREVASLRELIARQAVAPSHNKRAAYMREYRKLHPKS